MRRGVFFSSLLMFVLMLLILGGGLFMLGPGLEERIVPGVWLWATTVGGLRPSDALPKVREATALEQPRIVLVGPEDQRWAFSPADLGVALDVQATLAQIYEVGHIQEDMSGWWERLRVMSEGRAVSPVLAWNREYAAAQLRALAVQLNREPEDAGLGVDGQTLVLKAGLPGRRLEVTKTLESLYPFLIAPQAGEVRLLMTNIPPSVTDEEAAQALDIARTIVSQELLLVLPHPRSNDPGPWSLSRDVLTRMLGVRSSSEEGVWVSLNEDDLRQFLEPLAMALYREPEECRFSFDPTTEELIPLTPTVDGRALDVEATVEHINKVVQFGQHVIPLVLDITPPKYPDTITAEEMGIRELVGVGESYFTGSSSARDKNIRLGASQFDGVVVAPGEIFSFNEYLGDVTLEKGYDESYVIIGNRTVPGVGGGICQVATTVFRAAFYGGYEIVERWPHAYRVSYYELGGFGPGFDATIYSPLVDFRFKNDTAYPLLIQTEVDAARARLRFLFYSTSEGRAVEQIGPTAGEPKPPEAPIYEYDPDMPPGTVQRLERAHNGLDAVLERVVRDAEGNILHQDRFVSHFIPWPARYRYGPDFIPPLDAVVVTPEPIPEPDSLVQPEE